MSGRSRKRTQGASADDYGQIPPRTRGDFDNKLWMDWDKYDFIQWFRSFNDHDDDVRRMWKYQIDGKSMEALLQYCMQYIRKTKKKWTITLPKNPIEGMSAEIIEEIHNSFWIMATGDLADKNVPNKK